jgi:MFS family permease
MEPEERSNTLKVAGTDVCHGTGMGFVAPATVLPLLFRKLGASELEIGLLGAVVMAGFVLGQPLGMATVGRRRRTKAFFSRWILIGWAGVHMLMCVAFARLGLPAPGAARAALLVLCAIITFGDGMILPIWADWQGRIFSIENRGRAMGMVAGAWAFGQGAGALAAGQVEKVLPYPANYVALFALATVMFSLSSTFVARVREPSHVVNGRESFSLAQLPGFLRESLGQLNFRRYMVARVLLACGAGAAAFFAVHFKSEAGGGLDESLVIKLGALTAFCQFFFSNVLGRLGDRVGHKRAVELGALAQIAAIAIAASGRGPFACGACFAVAGISWSSAYVSHYNVLFETCPHGHRIAHIALSNAIIGPFVLLSPLALGWAIGYLGTGRGMMITLIPTALALLWLIFRVREPRSLPPIRFPDQSSPPSAS